MWETIVKKISFKSSYMAVKHSQPEGKIVESLYTLHRKQSIGVPVTPLVKVGDEVNKGTLLGVSDGLGVPLHASVKGTVSAVTDDAIEISASVDQTNYYEKIRAKGSIADIAKEAGLCGLGGAGFPTYVKLGTDLNGGTLLVNAVVCEPLLEHNLTQMIEGPAEV